MLTPTSPEATAIEAAYQDQVKTLPCDCQEFADVQAESLYPLAFG
jgi:hypothetical protein